MVVIEKQNGIFKRLIRQAIFRLKLYEMDQWWYFLGKNSWELFPPSFYYTHTDEEIKRIKAEMIEMLYKLWEK